MDIQYHHELTARGTFFAFAEVEDFLIVTCRSCAHRSVYGQHAAPLLIRDDMDSHLKDAHPDLPCALVYPADPNIVPPPENPA